MTKEERENAIKVIKNYDLNFYKINGLLFKASEIANAFDCALEALEQEPTKEEQALLQKWRDNRGISIEDFEDAMNALQEPKTGHWTAEWFDVNGEERHYCSECYKWEYTESDYCPNCGCRMVEPQERSDK